MRPIIAIAAAALLAVTFFSTEASARLGGGGFRGGGFHGGGFHGGGFRGGFHGGIPRRVPSRLRLPPFRTARRVRSTFVYGAYAGWPSYSYAYGDDCLAPRRVWTPYGWRIRWINVCY